MKGATEAIARGKIDALVKDAGWNLTDGSSLLFDRQGWPMTTLEAKRASTEPIAAQDQERHDAEQVARRSCFVEWRGSAILLQRD